MGRPTLSRRQLLAACGTAAGAAMLPGTRTALATAASIPYGARTDLIQLNSNENPYGLGARALEALTRCGATASRYPDAREDELKAALAAAHGVKPEQIVLGSGSSEILRMADAAFLAGGKEIVAAETTFEAVLLYAGVMRAPVTKVPMTADFRHDLTAMAAACGEETGILYVCNPNNPTGTIVGRAEIAELMRRVPASTVVLFDEAYHHFVEDPAYGSALDLLARHPNLVVARTFSKIYGMAGLRLGYGVASDANAAALSKQAAWNNVNAAALDVALQGLSDTGLVARERQRINDTRRWLCAELDKDGRRYIRSHTNFLMIEAGGDVGPVIAGFRERGILVGRRFAAMPTWLRVSVGTPREMESFLTAWRAIVPARAAA
jgi:histidinol-phosphate aminotransferase